MIRLVALGHTNAEISQQLYLSVRTVESHRAHIQEKAGQTTRAELVAYAGENGLLDDSSEACVPRAAKRPSRGPCDEPPRAMLSRGVARELTWIQPPKAFSA